MTVEEAKKRADELRDVGDRDAVALRVLADALRAAEGQVVAMREDAARVCDAAADLAQRDRATSAAADLRFAAKDIRALPAPAVAPVAAPRPLHPADCAHDSTPEVSVPHMPDPCGFVNETNGIACPMPRGHAGWHQTPSVAAPKPVAFDAEAALQQGAIELQVEGPIDLRDVFAAMLAAGRGGGRAASSPA